MNTICPPNLTLAATVAWHFKQFAAGLILVLFMGVLVWGFVAYQEKLNRKQKENKWKN